MLFTATNFFICFSQIFTKLKEMYNFYIEQGFQPCWYYIYMDEKLYLLNFMAFMV